MNKLSLLGSVALAASLIAGTAMAQNANNNGMANANSQHSSHLYSEGVNGNGYHGHYSHPVINPQRYANVGFGGYTGHQLYIRNGNNGNNGNNNNGGWGSGGWANNGNNWGRNGNNNANNNDWRPSQRNGALADNGDVRASKAIGTGVYNSQNQQVGTINDILLGRNGVFAVIKTNNKNVAIPFRRLRFGNTVNNGNEEIVLPNATQARLNTLPVFHYDVTNYQAYQNAGNNNGNGNGGGNYASNGRNGNGWFGGGAFNNGNPRNGTNQHGGGNNR